MTTIYISCADMIRHSGRLYDFDSENAAERLLDNSAAADVHLYLPVQQWKKSRKEGGRGHRL